MPRLHCCPAAAGVPAEISSTLRLWFSTAGAMHNFGAGMMPADTVFDCELMLCTFAPAGPGSFVRVPDPRRFGHPPFFSMFRAGDGFMATFRVRGDRGCVRMTLEESDDLLNWMPAAGGSNIEFPGTGNPGTTMDGFLPFSPVFLERPRHFARVRFSRM